MRYNYHVLLRYEVCWQVTHRLQSMSYSGMRFVEKLHAYYNPCLTPVWGLLTSYTQITIHVLLRYGMRLQFMFTPLRFVDRLHADYNPYLTPVWGLLTRYTQTTIHVLLWYEVCWQVTCRLQSILLWYEVCWQVTRRLQSMSYSGMRFVDKLHADYNPCLTRWGLLTSYTQTTIYVLLWYEVLTPLTFVTGFTQTTIHVLLQYEVCCQVTHRLQSMSYYGMRFVDKLHAGYNPCRIPVWGLLTSYTQITIHVLLWYEVCWQVTHRLQSMSYSGMRFVDKLHADYNPCLTPVRGLLTRYTDYNPCLTPVWGLLTSYTQTTIHVLLRYEVHWQSYTQTDSGTITRLQFMSYSGMRFVDKLHADYNPCLTPVWGLLISYTQTTIHVLLRYEVCWQVTRRLRSMSYSGMRFVDKLQADYNSCLTPVWGLLTGYTQTTIHILLRYEVYWQDTRRLQSMSYSGMRFVDKLHADYNSSYSGMRFVDKLHADYNPCLTPVWGLLTSYTQTTIHVLLRYEVCWQVTRRLQSMSYSGMRFVDKLHADLHSADYNPFLIPVSLQDTRRLWWVRWQVTDRLQSMSNSGMRFVDRLHADYNPCLTPVWGLLTSYTQTTMSYSITRRLLLRYEVCWQVTHRLQSMSYSGMRFVDKLHTDYNPCLTLVWGLLTSYTQTTIHVLLRYEVCWQDTHRLLHVLLRYEVCWQVTHRLQSMSYSGMRFVDKLHADYNPCLTPVWGLLTSYTQITIHVLLRYEVCWQVTHRLQSMSYSGMRFVDKLHAYYNPCLTPVWGLLTSRRYDPCLTPVWGLLTSYRQTTIHVLLRYEVCWQVTRRLQSISYSGMRFIDKIHADYNPCLTLVWGLLTSYMQTTIHLTLVWGLLTSYTQITIHVLLRYEVCWQVTRRLQSMSYYGEVCWQVTRRLQSMSYSGMTSYRQTTMMSNSGMTQVSRRLQSMSYSSMRFVVKLHTDCTMSYYGMRFVDKLHAGYNPCRIPVWGLLTSYTQITIHVLLWYEVCWQVTHRLQSMSYSGMRFVDKLHADYNPCLTPVRGLLTRYTDYNPCLTPVWGLLTSYTQTTIHVLLRYEVYSVDKLHADYNPCLTPVWGLLTSYTQTTIHVLLRYEVCW